MIKPGQEGASGGGGGGGGGLYVDKILVHAPESRSIILRLC
jgi:hypothetical protein